VSWLAHLSHWIRVIRLLLPLKMPVNSCTTLIVLLQFDEHTGVLLVGHHTNMGSVVGVRDGVFVVSC
jgi:hypothetical protein